MSRARSASTGRSYGRARVLKAWGLPRSTFYERRRRPLLRGLLPAMAPRLAIAMKISWPRSGAPSGIALPWRRPSQGVGAPAGGRGAHLDAPGAVADA
jgi:hypothetical protein